MAFRTPLMLAAVFAMMGGAHAQDRPAATPPASVVEKPPAPAFKANMSVLDRTGADVGRIETLAESAARAMVVINIDGKLVSVPQDTLTLDGQVVRSRQSKAEMLAAAGAPR